MNIFGPAISPRAPNECIDWGWIFPGKKLIQEGSASHRALGGGEKNRFCRKLPCRLGYAPFGEMAGVVLLGIASWSGVCVGAGYFRAGGCHGGVSP